MYFSKTIVSSLSTCWFECVNYFYQSSFYSKKLSYRPKFPRDRHWTSFSPSILGEKFSKYKLHFGMSCSRKAHHGSLCLLCFESSLKYFFLFRGSQTVDYNLLSYICVSLWLYFTFHHIHLYILGGILRHKVVVVVTMPCSSALSLHSLHMSSRLPFP